jgi:hypothetical protein
MGAYRDSAAGGTATEAAAARALERAALTSAKPSWLELEWLEERSDGANAWIAVTLGCNGRQVTGLSPKVGRKQRLEGAHRAVLATMSAVEVFAHHHLECELLDVGLLHAGGVPSVAVRLRLVMDDEVADVFGSARVAGEVAEAAARAVLDAANVYIDYLLSHSE